MNLLNMEKLFEDTYKFDELKNKAISNIQDILYNSCNNFLNESNDKLPEGVLYKDLQIEYRSTYIIVKRENGAKPSFRLIFDLLEPNSKEELFTYEIEYNCDGDYSDDFFLDY